MDACAVSQIREILCFVTYRDPNLSESYKVYDEAADYVADF